NNPVSISFAEALLNEQGIGHFIADQHMSIMEGSLGILPRRIMVEGEKLHQARKLMQDAGLGDELPKNLIREYDG
ncbi:MAG: DUF2007 domain-containing protein, partial [Rhizobiaceae bacterium]